MNLIHKVNQDLTSNLKAGNRLEVDVLRMLKNSLDIYIKEKGEISQEDEIKIVRKEIKSREEARTLYETHSEAERAAKEEQEAIVLKKYLPKELSVEEIEKIVEGIISKNPTANFGQVMGEAMKSVKGHADGKTVSSIIKNKIEGEK